MSTLKITENDALTRMLQRAAVEPGYIAVARVEGRSANGRKKERQIGRIDCPDDALLQRVHQILRDAVRPGDTTQLRVRRYDATANKTELLVTVTQEPAPSHAATAASQAPPSVTPPPAPPDAPVELGSPPAGVVLGPSGVPNAPHVVFVRSEPPLHIELARLHGELARRDGVIDRHAAEIERLQAELMRANDQLLREEDQRLVLSERLDGVQAERDEHAAEVRSLRRTVRRHERESEALAEQLLELEEALPTVGFGWGR